MSAQGNQADIPIALPSRLVVRSNNRQTSILTRCSRVGLEGAGVETSDLAKVRLEFLGANLAMA
jgi:hypothetical protein